jgi:hypothetical protein
MTAPRRRWSFSLRTLFVVVTVFASVAFAVTERWRTSRLERKISELNAQVRLSASDFEAYKKVECHYELYLRKSHEAVGHQLYELGFEGYVQPPLDKARWLTAGRGDLPPAVPIPYASLPPSPQLLRP